MAGSRVCSASAQPGGENTHAEGPVPAARKTLADAGVSFAQLDAASTHNPFTVNDLWLSTSTGIASSE
jgi:acetyl-CoA C-acetyltransferase